LGGSLDIGPVLRSAFSGGMAGAILTFFVSLVKNRAAGQPQRTKFESDSLRAASSRDRKLGGAASVAMPSKSASSIEANLFGPRDAGDAAWSPRRLLKRVAIARHRLLRPGTVAAPTVLPGGLNPSTPQHKAFCGAPSLDDRSQRPLQGLLELAR
jgi:hypothetical protein